MWHNSTKHFPETLQSSHSSCNKSRIFFPPRRMLFTYKSVGLLSITHLYLTNIYSFGIGGFAPISVIQIYKQVNKEKQI